MELMKDSIGDLFRRAKERALQGDIEGAFKGLLKELHGFDFIREGRLKEARQAYLLATVSETNPGRRILEAEKILRDISAGWADISVTEEELAAIKKRGEIADALFQLQRLLIGSRQSAENIKNFINSLAPNIRDEIGLLSPTAAL